MPAEIWQILNIYCTQLTETKVMWICRNFHKNSWNHHGQTYFLADFPHLEPQFAAVQWRTATYLKLTHLSADDARKASMKMAHRATPIKQQCTVQWVEAIFCFSMINYYYIVYIFQLLKLNYCKKVFYSALNFLL